MDSAAEDVAEAGDTIRKKDGTGEDFAAGRHKAAVAGNAAVVCKRDDGRRVVRP